MFLRLLFKKYNIKQSKVLLATVYGLLYTMFIFLILLVAELYIGNVHMARNILLSLGIGVVMFAVYFIKEEIFKLKQ